MPGTVPSRDRPSVKERQAKYQGETGQVSRRQSPSIQQGQGQASKKDRPKVSKRDRPRFTEWQASIKGDRKNTKKSKEWKAIFKEWQAKNIWGKTCQVPRETGQVSRRDRPRIKEAEPKYPTRTGSSFIRRTGQKYQRGTDQVSQNDRPVSRGTGKITKDWKEWQAKNKWGKPCQIPIEDRPSVKEGRPSIKRRQAKCQGRQAKFQGRTGQVSRRDRPSFKEGQAKNQEGKDRPCSKAVKEVTWFMVIFNCFICHSWINCCSSPLFYGIPGVSCGAHKYQIIALNYLWNSRHTHVQQGSPRNKNDIIFKYSVHIPTIFRFLKT